MSAYGAPMFLTCAICRQHYEYRYDMNTDRVCERCLKRLNEREEKRQRVSAIKDILVATTASSEKEHSITLTNEEIGLTYEIIQDWLINFKPPKFV